MIAAETGCRAPCRSTVPRCAPPTARTKRLRRRAAAQAAPATAVHAEAAALAARLIEGARARKASGLDAFLQSYGLGTEEGIALMCLAEALLRVPDAETADALIHDKLAGIDWGEHLGEFELDLRQRRDLLADADRARCCAAARATTRASPTRCAARSGGSASR